MSEQLNMEQNRYAEAGQFIQTARESRKLSLEQAAKEMQKLGVPTSKSVLHRLEKGEGIVANFGDATFVRALAQILGVSQMELMVCEECGNALTVARLGKYYRCVRSYDNLILATERCSLAGYIRADQVQAHIHQRLEEALAHGLLAIDVTAEPPNELELKQVQQHIAELEKQAKRLATRLRTVTEEFANFLDGEIEQISTELATARRQETRLLHQRRVDDRLDRERALDGLRELTLERLWALPDLEINRWLHRVFGRTRLVVNAKTKVIVGRTKK